MERNEYQNRRLGELTDDILRERPELVGRPLYPDPEFGGTVGVKSASVDGNVGGDQVATKDLVISTYDIRPINGKDFFAQVVLSVPGEDPPQDKVFGAMTVPKGYVLVLREFSFRITRDSNPDAFIIRTVFSVGVDNGVRIVFGVSGTADLYFIPVTDFSVSGLTSITAGCYPVFDKQKTHVIVPEDSTLFFGATNLPTDNSDYAVVFELYGNLLATRGRPSNEEIGT